MKRQPYNTGYPLTHRSEAAGFNLGAICLALILLLSILGLLHEAASFTQTIMGETLCKL